MGTTITFRRGPNDPTSGSGLTLAEPAFNTTLKTFHIGLGHGITAAWVGAPISGLSADIAAGITYKISTAAAVKNYIGGLCYGNTGAPTITQYVSSFNGLTGAVGGVCAAQANTFTALQGFSQGIVVDSGLTAYEIFVNGGVIRNTAGPLEVSSTFGTQSGIGFDVYGNSTITSNNNPIATFNENSIFAHVPVVANYGLTASTLNVTGNAVVVGNLTVSGGVTFTISENVLIEDNIITLNSNVTGSPSENAGIEIERGTSANVQLLWNESSDKWTFTNDGSTYYDLPTSVVTSFNGLTGAVGGVCAAQSNTFTAVQTFNSGVTLASTLDVTGVARLSGGVTASRIDVTGNFKVVGDAQIGDQNTDTFTVFAGTTFQNRTDFAGNNNFANGLTSSGNIRFSGTSAKTIVSNQATLTIAGVSTSSILVGSNSVVMGVQVSDSLTLNSATSIVDISTTTSGVYPTIPSIRIITDDGDTIGAGSIKIIPASYATANRTQYLQDASGTLALTSQLMGAVNGSTAATTAVTSFNGSTGAVQGVSSFNGLTGAVGGVCAAQANTFTALQSFNSGISSAGGTFNQETRFAAGLSASTVKTLNLSGYGGLSPSFIDGQFRLSQLMGTFTTVQSSGSTDRTISLPDADGTLALTSQLMGAINGSTAATTAVTSFNGRTGAVQGVSAAVAGTGISVSGATGAVTITNTGVQTFNGLTGAVTGVTVGGANTFTALNTFSAGISATGATFSSTTNTLDVIASTEGAGLRIAKAVTGANSRIGGIRLGRSGTTAQNTYLEGSAGAFSLYNGVDNTGTVFATFSPTQFSLGTSTASFITLNSPNLISFGDQSAVGNNQVFSMSGTARTYTFGDPNGVTTGFVGINRSGLCADYALEVNSPTGKGLQLIYNDHTGAASNWVNMDVSSGGNYTLRPSGGLATVTGTLNVSAGVCAAGATFSGNISAPNIVTSFNGLTGAVQGVSAAAAGDGIAVSGATGAVTITNTGVTRAVAGTGISVSGATGSVTFTNIGVQSFNGATGAVTGASLGANTFTALNTFNAGISAAGGVTFAGTFSGTTGSFSKLLTLSDGLSAAGATFSGDIAVNGGDITTTSATATLYNTTATTVNIGNAASTVNLMGATANTQTGIGSMCYVKTGQTSTTTTAKQEIFRYPTVTTSTADRYFADIIVTANYGNIVSGSIGSQITKMLVATSYNTAINHTEYGNVNTSGNLAVYTAEISGDNVIIYATPTNGFTTVFNVYATLITGTYGPNTEE